MAASHLAREKPGQTLQPTALVHEAWLRLIVAKGCPEPAWNGRRHFFAAAADPETAELIKLRFYTGLTHQQADGFLPSTEPGPLPFEGPGSVIGRYRLLQEIGEGGFGQVFMAEQTEPVRRKVALKIIKAGMDTREVTARFEAERQALALMDHPNIARVLDGGATPAGRPFFVMELIHGIPITEYCDRERIPAATSTRSGCSCMSCSRASHLLTRRH